MDAPQRSRGRGRGGRGNRGGRGGGNSMMGDDGNNRRSQRQNIKSPVVAQFSRRGKGGNRGGGGGGRGPAMIQDNDSGPFTVTVSGWDQLQDPNQLAEWLQQCVGHRIDFVKAEMKGNRMAVFVVDDLSVAMAIQKLSGRKFNGKALNIRRTGGNRQNQGSDTQMGGTGGGGAGGHQGPVNLLASLDTLYDSRGKMLNLQHVSSSQFETGKLDLNNINMMNRLFEILRERCPDVVTINFARNNIRNLVPFQRIQEFLPHCVNLCFEGNRLADFKQLDALKNIKLRELILTDNPMCAKTTYKEEVTRRFPQLEFLDSTQVRPLFKFADIPDIVLPPEKPAFFDLEANKNFAGSFLQKFFAVYDSIKREDLLDVYTDRSFFSVSAAVLSADAQASGNQQQQQQQQGGRRQGKHHTQDASGNLSAYINFSHNLIKVHDASKRAETMYKGRVDIVGALKKLPNTRHQLDDLKVEAFVLEAQPLQLLSIHVHGHFWDVGTEVKRSFNRLLLLTPAGPHTRAYQSGWPALIVNDMLTVHNYLTTKTPASPAAAHAHSSAAPPQMMIGVPAVHMPPGLTAEQQTMVQNFVALTNLRHEYAADCLAAAAWHVTNAMTLYMNRKIHNLLPVEAWLPGTVPR